MHGISIQTRHFSRDCRKLNLSTPKGSLVVSFHSRLLCILTPVRYARLEETHYTSAVLQSLPIDQQGLDDNIAFMPPMSMLLLLILRRHGTEMIQSLRRVKRERYSLMHDRIVLVYNYQSMSSHILG